MKILWELIWVMGTDLWATLYIFIKSHDTGRGFEPIFMLVLVIHGWNLLFLETIGSIVPWYRGKCVPKTGFWAFIQLVSGFWGKNSKIVFGTPFLIKKGYLLFLSSDATFPQKWPCFPKIIFRGYLKKLLSEKYSKTSFPTKKVLLIFVARRPFPLKTVLFSRKRFFVVFKLLFSKNLFNYKNIRYLIRDKKGYMWLRPQERY